MTDPVTVPGRILKYFQDDAMLQALARGGVKIAYADLPPSYPSVTFAVMPGPAEPRAGYNENLVCDHNPTYRVHVWVKKADNTASGRGDNGLVMAIDERVRILWMNIGKTIPEIRDLVRSSGPVNVPDPDLQVHHSTSAYTFVYATIDTI